MAEHSELISEIPQLERMTAPERMHQAKKRRSQQLKKWRQKEREYSRGGGVGGSTSIGKKKKTEQNMQQRRARPKQNCQVHFKPSVMLLEAASRSDIDEVRRLMILGVQPDATNEDGLTAIHQCCVDDNREMMALLVEYGADVNAVDSEKWTPLHAAATCGHLELVKFLIGKGANLLAVNVDGNMPYDICDDDKTLDYIEGEMSNQGITQELIDETRASPERMMLDDMRWLAQQNGDIEYRDENGATPLHIAAANGYVRVVEFLLDQSVATEVADDDMWMPVHAAACWGHMDVLERLGQVGASLEVKTKNGETPYDICEDPEMRERIMQLRSEIEFNRSTQVTKLGRSQSQNTRSHSVRRTSIRDKEHMTRKEAVEEAKLRIGYQELQTDSDTSQKMIEVDKRNWENTKQQQRTGGGVGGDFDGAIVGLDHISVSINGGTKSVVSMSNSSSPAKHRNDTLATTTTATAIANTAPPSHDTNNHYARENNKRLALTDDFDRMAAVNGVHHHHYNHPSSESDSWKGSVGSKSITNSSSSIYTTGGRQVSVNDSSSSPNHSRGGGPRGDMTLDLSVNLHLTVNAPSGNGSGNNNYQSSPINNGGSAAPPNTAMIGSTNTSTTNNNNNMNMNNSNGSNSSAGINTLAELKRIRNDIRKTNTLQRNSPATSPGADVDSPPLYGNGGHNNQNYAESSSVGTQVANNGGDYEMASGHNTITTVKTLTPPLDRQPSSPSISMKRFTANTSDEVVGSKQKQSCCVIL